MLLGAVCDDFGAIVAQIKKLRHNLHPCLSNAILKTGHIPPVWA
jgi:hypothetical protein